VTRAESSTHTPSESTASRWAQVSVVVQLCSGAFFRWLPLTLVGCGRCRLRLGPSPAAVLRCSAAAAACGCCCCPPPPPPLLLLLLLPLLLLLLLLLPPLLLCSLPPAPQQVVEQAYAMPVWSAVAALGLAVRVSLLLAPRMKHKRARVGRAGWRGHDAAGCGGTDTAAPHHASRQPTNASLFFPRTRALTHRAARGALRLMPCGPLTLLFPVLPLVSFCLLPLMMLPCCCCCCCCCRPLLLPLPPPLLLLLPLLLSGRCWCFCFYVAHLGGARPQDPQRRANPNQTPQIRTSRGRWQGGRRQEKEAVTTTTPRPGLPLSHPQDHTCG
jgi:hypothetical protein